MYKLWEALESARQYRWVELSHSLNNDSPYWAGIPEGSVELSKTVFDWGNPMLECLIQTFKFPGQFGTHIDFPGHFIKGAALSDQFGAKDAVFPLCVVDISGKVAKDPCYAVTVEDIKEYEAKYGPIPAGAFVALRTDWSKHWPDMAALSGLGEDTARISPAGRWRRSSISMRSAMPRPMATRRWTPTPPPRPPRPAIWPASDMFWRRASCRWRCWITSIRSRPPAQCCSWPGPASKARWACPCAAGPSPNKKAWKSARRGCRALFYALSRSCSRILNESIR